jgi:hypothetical protein
MRVWVNALSGTTPTKLTSVVTRNIRDNITSAKEKYELRKAASKLMRRNRACKEIAPLIVIAYIVWLSKRTLHLIAPQPYKQFFSSGQRLLVTAPTGKERRLFSSCAKLSSNDKFGSARKGAAMTRKINTYLE